MNSILSFILHPSTVMRNTINHCDLDINRYRSYIYFNNKEYPKLRFKLALSSFVGSDEVSFECVLYEVTDKCIDVGVYETRDLDVFYISNIGINTTVASSSLNINKKFLLSYLLNKITQNNVLLERASKGYIESIDMLEDILKYPSLKEVYIHPETRLMADVN